MTIAWREALREAVRSREVAFSCRTSTRVHGLRRRKIDCTRQAWLDFAHVSTVSLFLRCSVRRTRTYLTVRDAGGQGRRLAADHEDEWFSVVPRTPRNPAPSCRVVAVSLPIRLLLCFNLPRSRTVRVAAVLAAESGLNMGILPLIRS